MSSNASSLSYHEPGIVAILILSSFLLLLNIVNYGLDRIVYCGLIGQIFIGVGWGTPGAAWLSLQVQDTVMQLGYLGLILIVYEGGLSTNIKTLKANLALSATVALIGISAPIGLSFVLMGLLPSTPLQAFAAGAALCSTSLGTTFTVLATSGLTESRLGVVLSSAAMMDDVVGLIMVQVITNLGRTSTFNAVTVIRPVLVSIAFAVVVPMLCVWVVKPAAKWLHELVTTSKSARLEALLQGRQAAFVLHTGVLLAMVTGSTYAGTSNLFAAYLAGACISWFDGFVATLAPLRATSAEPSNVVKDPSEAASPSQDKPAVVENKTTGVAIYESYYQPAVDFVLKPFFFASIGFSIPITRMFSGEVVWRGIVYAALMTFGKLLCGACLMRLSLPWPASKLARNTKEKSKKKGKVNFDMALPVKIPAQESEADAISLNRFRAASVSPKPPLASSSPNQSQAGKVPDQPTANSARKRSSPKASLSLYPAAILGSAMVARGEIGFLISSVAESNGVFGAAGAGGSSELFLIVTWAILICTLLGPVTVGLMVRRVKRLQEGERGERSGRADPLGSWGIVAS